MHSRAHQTPLPTWDIVQRVRETARSTPNARALIDHSGAVTTYRELMTRVAHIEQGLVTHGVRRGDRVLFAIRPTATAVATLMALTSLGAVVVAAPIGAGDELFAAQMQLVQPAWVVAESVLVLAMRHRIVRAVAGWKGVSMPSAASIPSARWVSSGPWFPGLGGVARLEHIERRGRPLGETSGAASLSETVSGAMSEMDDASTSDAFVVFTSGSTGAPKAVVHSRASLSATIHVVCDVLDIAANDVLYARDMHLVLPALLAGATVFLPGGGDFHAGACLRSLRVHGITHLFEVTAHVQQLVTLASSTASLLPPSLRLLLIGAAPVRPAFFRALQRVLPNGASAWCVYGMTEMLPIATISLPDKLAYVGYGDIVGAPVAGVHVRVADAGELAVSGAHLFSGYLENATDGSVGVSSTRHPLAEHMTGDLARIDAHGRIVLSGRLKDMIIRREFNIYPELYEPTIERIDGVARCALVGVFDESTADEVVVLAVQPSAAHASPTAREQLIKAIRQDMTGGRHCIDRAAQPDHIVLMNLPVTMRSGKVDKNAVRDLVVAQLS